MYQLLLLLICTGSLLYDTPMSDFIPSKPLDPTILKYLYRAAAAVDQPAPTLILLHGYGSDEHNLFALKNAIPTHWNVISLQAPLKMHNGSYKWYTVHQDHNGIQIQTEEAKHSMEMVGQWIHSHQNQLNIHPQKIVLAGFSQGGSLAASMALNYQNQICAFAVFSGRFLNELAPLHGNHKVAQNAFLSHGDDDTMLPITYQEEFSRQLEFYGINVHRVHGPSGHEISSKQWNDFLTWLSTLALDNH